MTRRRRGRRTGLVVLLILGLVAGGLGWYVSRPGLSTVGAVAFTRPLAIPPLAPSSVDADGRRVFTLRAAAGVTDFGHGPTRTAGYDGGYLGPTLRARQGERVRVNLYNGLAEDTTVHWHGMVLPAGADGGPHHPVRPGARTTADWTVTQPAGTLWYHPHSGGRTEHQVQRGLAGLFLLDDGSPAAAALPQNYGVDDVPVIVQDRRFDRAGQFVTRPELTSDIGVLGDTLLVNGTIGPYHEVRTGLVRLRLVNASAGRIYRFGFGDDRAFTLAGTDGGLAPTPMSVRRVQLSAGERADVVVALRPGERVVLRSFPPEGPDNLLIRRFQGGDDAFDVLQLRAADRLTPGGRPPPPDAAATPPDLTNVAQHRSLDFYRRSINGRTMDVDRVDAIVTAGSTEIWRLRNTHVMPHSFHLHGQRFRVLDVAGRPPPAELSGWKDTVYLPPGQTVRIVITFSGHADETTPFMFHCHVLRHEDQGMMGQLLLVRPGRQPNLWTQGHPGERLEHG